MKKTLLALSLCALILSPMADVLAKGGGGGGRGGGGSRSSVSHSSTPKPSPSTPAQTPKTITKTPPKTIESTKPVVSASGKKMNGTGTVVDANNRPTFRGGYQPPVGSTVYYPQRDFMDYLPWIFLFTMSPNREVVVQASSTDGVVTEETHVEEGTDSMYIWNWVFSIALLGGLIYFIMRMLSRKKKENVKDRYRGW